MNNRDVQTFYGPMPGCPDCGVVLIHGGPHICEHGVTVAPEITASFTVTMDVEAYDAMLWWFV